jgi:hypothetical protein
MIRCVPRWLPQQYHSALQYFGQTRFFAFSTRRGKSSSLGTGQSHPRAESVFFTIATDCWSARRSTLKDANTGLLYPSRAGGVTLG